MSAKRLLRLGLLTTLLVLTVASIWACSGSTDGENVSIPGTDVTETTEPPGYDIDPPTNNKFYITFKKDDGTVVGQDCVENGGGQVNKPEEPFDTADWSTEKPKNWQDEEPVPRDKAHFPLGGGDHLVASPISLQKVFEYGCFRETYDSTKFNPSFTLTIQANDRAEAEALGSSLGQNGVGTVVPGDVHVDSYVRWTVIGNAVWIGSSKVGVDFADYQLTVNGSVIADLATLTNVTEIDDGNGWKTLWSSTPLTSMVLGANQVSIVQREVGQTQSYTVDVGFNL